MLVCRKLKISLFFFENLLFSLISKKSILREGQEYYSLFDFELFRNIMIISTVPDIKRRIIPLFTFFLCNGIII